MKVHILGVCGTFMAGLALIAKELGHDVAGSDQAIYPPMSTQLCAAGVHVQDGYSSEQLQPAPDLVVIGNALSRGNTAVEHVLNQKLRYTSGPAWLRDEVLSNRRVIAVSGTHGKTTVSSMIAYILEQAGHSPGFLIGGVPLNFGCSARLGNGEVFVVEADEYDTAFFDKRSKFIHYAPDILVINNLEFDHADIFENLQAIQRQFHHLIRTVPGNGLIIHPHDDENVAMTLQMGCWTPCVDFALADGRWGIANPNPDVSQFNIELDGTRVGRVNYALIGLHNAKNALAAIAAAQAVDVPVPQACLALSRFQNVRRRLELRATVDGIKLYDDFAHHPTAIQATLAALRAQVGEARILAVIDPVSNTMRMGVHRDTLAQSLSAADDVIVHRGPRLQWDPSELLPQLHGKSEVIDSVEDIVLRICDTCSAGDHVLIMSNGSFDGLHERLISALRLA